MGAAGGQLLAQLESGAELQRQGREIPEPEFLDDDLVELDAVTEASPSEPATVTNDAGGGGFWSLLLTVSVVLAGVVVLALGWRRWKSRRRAPRPVSLGDLSHAATREDATVPPVSPDHEMPPVSTDHEMPTATAVTTEPASSELSTPAEHDAPERLLAFAAEHDAAGVHAAGDAEEAPLIVDVPPPAEIAPEVGDTSADLTEQVLGLSARAIDSAAWPVGSMAPPGGLAEAIHREPAEPVSASESPQTDFSSSDREVDVEPKLPAFELDEVAPLQREPSMNATPPQVDLPDEVAQLRGQLAHQSAALDEARAAREAVQNELLQLQAAHAQTCSEFGAAQAAVVAGEDWQRQAQMSAADMEVLRSQLTTVTGQLEHAQTDARQARDELGFLRQQLHAMEQQSSQVDSHADDWKQEREMLLADMLASQHRQESLSLELQRVQTSVVDSQAVTHELETARAELAELRQASDMQQETVARLHGELETARAQRQQSADERDEFERNLREAEEQSVQIRATLQSQLAELDAARQSAGERDVLSRQHEETIHRLESDRQQLLHDVDQMREDQQRLAAAATAAQERLQAVDQQAQQSTELAHEQDERVRQAESRVQLAEEQARQAEERVRRAEQQSQEAAESLREAREQAHHLDERARQAEQRAHELAESAREAREQGQQVNERAEQAERQAREAADTLAQVEQRCEQFEAAARSADERWHEQLTAAESALKSQTRHVQELETRMSEVQHAKEGVDRQLADALHQLNEARSQYQRVVGDLRAADARAGELVDQMEAAQRDARQTSQLQGEIQKLRADLQQESQQVATLQDALADAEERVARFADETRTTRESLQAARRDQLQLADVQQRLQAVQESATWLEHDKEAAEAELHQLKLSQDELRTALRAAEARALQAEAAVETAVTLHAKHDQDRLRELAVERDTAVKAWGAAEQRCIELDRSLREREHNWQHVDAQHQQLQAALAEQQTDNQQLAAALARAQQELATHDGVEAKQLDSIRRRFEAADASLRQAREELVEVSREKQQALDWLTRSEQQVRDLRATVQRQERQVDELTHRLDSLLEAGTEDTAVQPAIMQDERLAELSRARDDAEAQLKHARRTIEELRATANRERSTSQDLSATRVELDDAQRMVSELRAAVKSQEAEVATLQRKTVTADEQLKQQQHQNRQLLTSLRRLEKQAAEGSAEAEVVAALKKQNSSLESSLKKSSTKAGTAEGQRKEATTKLRAAERRVASLEKKLTTSTKEVDKLKQRKKDLEQELRTRKRSHGAGPRRKSTATNGNPDTPEPDEAITDTPFEEAPNSEPQELTGRRPSAGD